jgi:hypothetical protein
MNRFSELRGAALFVLACQGAISMNLILGFAPFILFAIFTRLSVDVALWLAFAAAFVVAIRDFVEQPSLRLLDGGSLALFAGLALWRGFIQPDLSLAAVRLMADLGKFLILSSSLLRRRPFSLEYADRQTSGQTVWPMALFRRVNFTISAVWIAGFALMSAADAVVTFHTGMPLYVAIATDLIVLAGATLFTLRYPAYAEARLPSSQTPE